MLWGNANFNYNEATMAILVLLILRHPYRVNEGGQKPSLVSYMESHDEEQLMYKNKQFGNNNSNYNKRPRRPWIRMKLKQPHFSSISPWTETHMAIRGELNLRLLHRKSIHRRNS